MLTLQAGPHDAASDSCSINNSSVEMPTMHANYQVFIPYMLHLNARVSQLLWGLWVAAAGYVKYGYPIATATMMLAWGVLEFPKVMTSATLLLSVL